MHSSSGSGSTVPGRDRVLIAATKLNGISQEIARVEGSCEFCQMRKIVILVVFVAAQSTGGFAERG